MIWEYALEQQELPEHEDDVDFFQRATVENFVVDWTVLDTGTSSACSSISYSDFVD